MKRINVEIRQQEKLGRVGKVKLNPRTEEVRRSKSLERYTTKLLFGQDNRKSKDKYLKKLERNWKRQKSVSLEDKS